MPHTPEPWRGIETATGKNYKRTGTSFEVWGNPGYVCSVGPLGCPDIQRANMRFIAAAPVLVAACERALALCAGRGNDKRFARIAAIMEDVLALARGEDTP